MIGSCPRRVWTSEWSCRSLGQDQVWLTWSWRCPAAWAGGGLVHLFAADERELIRPQQSHCDVIRSIKGDWSSHLVPEVFGLLLTAGKRLNEIWHLQRDRCQTGASITQRDTNKNISPPITKPEKSDTSFFFSDPSSSPAGRSSVGRPLRGLRRRLAGAYDAAPSRATGHVQAVLTWLTGRQTGGGQPVSWSLQQNEQRRLDNHTEKLSLWRVWV